jgi:hypothetical protein
MIELVLDGDSQETVRFDLERFSIPIERARPHAFGSPDVFAHARKRKTALVPELDAVGFDDFGVDENSKITRFVFSGAINHENANIFANLRSC